MAGYRGGAMGRKWWRAALLTGALALLGCLGPAALPAVSSTAAASTRAPVYYLALGASKSVGVQPAVGHPHGEPTDRGYTNDVQAAERARWPDLRLVELGCPGVTTVGMAFGPSNCSYPEGTQLATAAAFLRRRRGRVRLLTIDAGFNDVVHCLHHRSAHAACLAYALDRLQAVLPPMLARLKAAAGPGVTMIGLQQEDPFAALARHGEPPAAQRFAARTVAVFEDLDARLDSIYSAAHVRVAHVASAFGLDTRSSGGAGTPADRQAGSAGRDAGPLDRVVVDRACAYTWMCAPAPLGPNLHPNTRGYRVIARAVIAALDRPSPAGRRGTDAAPAAAAALAAGAVTG